MRRPTISFLLMLLVVGMASGQAHQRPALQSGFYLELGSCTACGAYGDRIVQLLKQNSVMAFNGYAECSGSCFSPGQYAVATKINRSRTQGSEVGVVAGPFSTADSAMVVMQRLRSILKPVFDDWNQGWPNSSLTHDNGNAYNIQPLSIWLIKFGNASATSPSATIGTSVGSGDWTAFWNAFRAAVRRRNRQALLGMMSSSFEWGSDGRISREEVFNQMRLNGKEWITLEGTLAKGTLPYKLPGSSRPARVAKNPSPCRGCKYAEWAIFELGTDGKWRWVALMFPGD